MNYIVYTPAVQATANNFNGSSNKSANRRALQEIDGSRMVASHIGGAYDYETAKREAVKALKKELRQRGKI